MKIIVDDKIPYIREVLERITKDVRYIKGADITHDDLTDADALIVRTRTRCNRQLLEHTNVKFVATATIGIDHLDTQYLDSAGIRWVNCPGCNASSVGQYIETTLLSLQRDKHLRLDKSTLGIVGCGHVGKQVKRIGEKYGMRVIVNDPFIPDPKFVSLDDIRLNADVVTFHVPLTHSGPHHTYHLADRNFLTGMSRPDITIINTSRGGVVDERSLLEAMDCGIISNAVIDTWENEPDIDRELLRRAYIATPHIAGYSADGKTNADNMVIDSLCRFFNVPNPGLVSPPHLPASFSFNTPLDLYDPLFDTVLLKSHPEGFEEQRGNYRLRREKYEV